MCSGNPRKSSCRKFRPTSFSNLKNTGERRVLITRQHGLLPRRLTVTNPLSAVETVTRWLDEGDPVDIVNLDFAKAFDSVNHRLLLTRLKCYGFAPSVLNWIESYLRRRSFQVSVNGSLSQVAEAASGVPQVSV